LKCKGVSRTLPFFAIEDFNSSPPRDFVSFLYVEMQAQVFDARVSPTRVRNPLFYDLIVNAFMDDEA
jgi:hypothetical protein